MAVRPSFFKRYDQPKFGLVIGHMKILRSKHLNGQILVLNLGSSSLKFSLIHSISLEKEKSGSITLNLEDAIQAVMEWINEDTIIAIGYRVVQGGSNHISPELVSEKRQSGSLDKIKRGVMGFRWLGDMK